MAGGKHVKGLMQALKKGDERAINFQVSKILDAIHRDDPDFDADEVEEVNSALRHARQHDYIKAFSEALTAEDRNTFNTDKHYAQALIDTDMAAAALAPLTALAEASRDDFSKFSEAMGLLGRVHKDLFLKSSDKRKPAAVRHFNKSMQAYAEPWRIDPDASCWHASNLLALISMGQAEGIKVGDEFNGVEIAENLERVILNKPEDTRDYWDWASLAESRLGKGDWLSASGALGIAIDSGNATPFQLNGTLRQFKEVWLLQERGEDAAKIITWLERSLLGQPNGEVSLDADDIDRQLSAKESDLEALHSYHKMRSHAWVRKFLMRGDNIGSVVDKHSGQQKGTCCVIDGKFISKELAGHQLCLTNDHVISEYPDEYDDVTMRPLSPDDTAVKFTASDDPDRKYSVAEVIWSSPYFVHDACLFRLMENTPADALNLPIVDYVPSIHKEKPQEIFLISHPEKDELSYSFQNTDLIDHDAASRGKDSLTPGLIHYTTPSIPGSSGGVALNAELDMVGLHHAGGSEINRLNGELGTYAVNEAIWIQPILNAIRKNLAQKKKRWSEI